MAKMQIRVAAFFLSLVALPQNAFAPPPPPPAHGSLRAIASCRVDRGNYFAVDNSGLPPALRAFAGKRTGIMLRVCNDYDENTHYFVRSPGAPDLPVCEVFEQEIFPDMSGKMEIPLIYGSGNYRDDYIRVTGWSPEPPKNWQALGYTTSDAIGPVVLAQEKNGDCPSLTDPNFAHLDNVPPGLFKAIIGALREAPNPDLLRLEHATPEQFLNVRPVWVSCGFISCSASLSNGFTARFDVVDGTVKMTRIERFID